MAIDSLYQYRGAHPTADGTLFQVFAPNARHAYVVLSAYGEEKHIVEMWRNPVNIWEAFTREANVSTTYRYRIEEASGEWRTRTDPFSLSIIKVGGLCESIVCKTDSYHWNDAGWMHDRSQSDPTRKPLSIYEMSAEHWRKRDGRTISFRDLAHQIVEYQREARFTHVELYGVLDHECQESWGYQVDHFFAPNRRMGNADDFKYLVDLCHQNGIGVILDWIPAHYKHEHNGDKSQSLHDYDGTDHFGNEHSHWDTVFFNFDKPETRRLLLASALYWLKETHVDGIRVDAVSEVLMHSKQSAFDFLKELNKTVHEQFPGVLMIAEDSGGCPNLTQFINEGGLGFDAKIGIHLQAQMCNYFRTPYNERAHHEHHQKLLSNFYEGMQGSWTLAHSHDDTASGSNHQHGTLSSLIPTGDLWRKFADQRLFLAMNLFMPGIGHLLHMGDEIGQEWSWSGRLNAGEGAVEWHLLDNQNWHRSLLKYVGDLNGLYRSKPAFWKQGTQGCKMLSHSSENNVLGFHRMDFEGGRLALFFNFSTMGYHEYDFPCPSLHDDPELGYVRSAHEIFNSDGAQYGGLGNFQNKALKIIKNEHGVPTHFRLAMAPLSVVVAEECWE